jgi:hypothetical protein
VLEADTMFDAEDVALRSGALNTAPANLPQPR